MMANVAAQLDQLNVHQPLQYQQQQQRQLQQQQQSQMGQGPEPAKPGVLLSQSFSRDGIRPVPALCLGIWQGTPLH